MSRTVVDCELVLVYGGDRGVGMVIRANELLKG